MEYNGKCKCFLHWKQKAAPWLLVTLRLLCTEKCWDKWWYPFLIKQFLINVSQCLFLWCYWSYFKQEKITWNFNLIKLSWFLHSKYQVSIPFFSFLCQWTNVTFVVLGWEIGRRKVNLYQGSCFKSSRQVHFLSWDLVEIEPWDFLVSFEICDDNSFSSSQLFIIS